MKKYQLWLQRKCYEQHLFNLLQIKFSTSSQANTRRKHARLASNDLSHTPDLLSSESPKFYNSAFKSAPNEDYKQLQTSKISLNASSTNNLRRSLCGKNFCFMSPLDIKQANTSMAKRLKETKSAVVLKKHKQKEISFLNYKNRQVAERKQASNHISIRDQNYKSYIEWNKRTSNPKSKYQLIITITNLTTVLMSSCPQQLWCELVVAQKILKSPMKNYNDNEEIEFTYQLKHGMSGQFKMRLYKCKGLKSTEVGEYFLDCPQSDQSWQGWIRSVDARAQIQVRIQMQRVQVRRPFLNHN